MYAKQINYFLRNTIKLLIDLFPILGEIIELDVSFPLNPPYEYWEHYYPHFLQQWSFVRTFSLLINEVLERKLANDGRIQELVQLIDKEFINFDPNDLSYEFDNHLLTYFFDLKHVVEQLYDIDNKIIRNINKAIECKFKNFLSIQEDIFVFEAWKENLYELLNDNTATMSPFNKKYKRAKKLNKYKMLYLFHYYKNSDQFHKTLFDEANHHLNFVKYDLDKAVHRLSFLKNNLKKEISLIEEKLKTYGFTFIGAYWLLRMIKESLYYQMGRALGVIALELIPANSASIANQLDQLQDRKFFYKVLGFMGFGLMLLSTPSMTSQGVLSLAISQLLMNDNNFILPLWTKLWGIQKQAYLNLPKLNTGLTLLVQLLFHLSREGLDKDMLMLFSLSCFISIGIHKVMSKLFNIYGDNLTPQTRKVATTALSSLCYVSTPWAVSNIYNFFKEAPKEPCIEWFEGKYQLNMNNTNCIEAKKAWKNFISLHPDKHNEISAKDAEMFALCNENITNWRDGLCKK